MILAASVLVITLVDSRANLLGMTHKSGFSLIEILLAVVVATAGFTVVFRALAQTVDAASRARRWLAMTRAAQAQAARLELGYRSASPFCALPAPGTTTTIDGVTVSWTAAGDSVAATFTVEARAGTARRTLLDTLVAGAVCR